MLVLVCIVQNNTSAPVVSWEGFFVNRLHEENALLGSVERYPSQLEDFRKTIPSSLDDDEGERTVKAIPNERGIGWVFIYLLFLLLHLLLLLLILFLFVSKKKNK